MAHVPDSNPLAGAHRYRRYRPEATLLYQMVEQYYPEFAELMRRQDRQLPTFVHREFVNFLKCGRLEFGFLRVRCHECHAEKLVAFSCKSRGFCPSCGARRMETKRVLTIALLFPFASPRSRLAKYGDFDTARLWLSRYT